MALRQAQDERDRAEHVGAEVVLGGQRWQPIQKVGEGQNTDDQKGDQQNPTGAGPPSLEPLTYFSSGHLRPTK